MFMKYKRGAIPSPPDMRDYTIIPSAIAKAVPAKYEQRRPIIGKQGPSSCAKWAGAYSYEAVTGVRMCKGGGYGDREPGHYQGEGRIIRELLETLLKHGTCKHEDYNKEYEVSKAQEHIKANLTSYRAKAAPYKIESYARLTNEMAIKTTLKSGYGVIFCAPCPGFKADKSGIYRMDNPRYGYHAMAIIGWDGDHALCPQSWGTSFGKKGFCWVPFTDVLALNDVWAIKFADAKLPDGTTDAPNIIQRTLRKGMKGDDVKQLQGALIRLGYDLGKCGADGDYGTATYNAVRAYQYATGLVADGVAGLKTLGALYG